jgi:hypothetical protein
MAITSPLVLVERGFEAPEYTAAQNVNFTRKASLPDGSAFTDTSVTNRLEPRDITIQHQQLGSGATLRDKHRVYLVRNEVDSAGTRRRSTIALSIEVPAHDDFTIDKICRDLTALASVFGFKILDADPETPAQMLLSILRSES